ncbi:hypothetical protein CYMTET_30778 [Cymbomonas tetramitiformis]|uniref:BZIP domain-containing protein n=1 Tax=Cymbomonas tetramitiformis TaxID=36881 RepID=A0AAE0KTK3_9CHLO|nr:hypothetical protein CYMTET_30778 [Cymbomonas tetramitiformis]
MEENVNTPMVVSEVSPSSTPEEAAKAANSSVSVLSAAPKVSVPASISKVSAAFDSSSFRSEDRQAPASNVASAVISSVLANISSSASKAQTASLAPSSSEMHEAVSFSAIAAAIAASAPSEGAASASDLALASGQAISPLAIRSTGDTPMADSGETAKPSRKVQRRDMTKRREQNRVASQKYRERRKQRGEAMNEMATELNALKVRITEVEKAEDRLENWEDAVNQREEDLQKLQLELEMERRQIERKNATTAVVAAAAGVLGKGTVTPASIRQLLQTVRAAQRELEIRQRSELCEQLQDMKMLVQVPTASFRLLCCLTQVSPWLPGVDCTGCWYRDGCQVLIARAAGVAMAASQA